MLDAREKLEILKLDKEQFISLDVKSLYMFVWEASEIALRKLYTTDCAPDIER